MLTQIALTPTESKKLIAKAVARLNTVRKAADNVQIKDMQAMLKSISEYGRDIDPCRN